MKTRSRGLRSDQRTTRAPPAKCWPASTSPPQHLRRAAEKAAPAGRKLHHLRIARSREKRSSNISQRAPYLNLRPTRPAAIATRRSICSTPFHDELKPLLPSLHPLWTHNDLHASNLFWSDTSPHARATAVIDFGLADRTNAVYDIAQAIERNIVEWLVLMRDPEHGEDVPVHLDHLWAHARRL